jgi:hypothetical protein
VTWQRPSLSETPSPMTSVAGSPCEPVR